MCGGRYCSTPADRITNHSPAREGRGQGRDDRVDTDGDDEQGIDQTDAEPDGDRADDRREGARASPEQARAHHRRGGDRHPGAEVEQRPAHSDEGKAESDHAGHHHVEGDRQKVLRDRKSGWATAVRTMSTSQTVASPRAVRSWSGTRRRSPAPSPSAIDDQRRCHGATRLVNVGHEELISSQGRTARKRWRSWERPPWC